MLKHTRISRRIILPLALAISLLFAFVPAVLVATHAQSPSLHLFGPKQHYLALGDSLAFGFQPCQLTPPVPPSCSPMNGYVYDLFNTLKSEGTKDVTDLGCPSETSTTFIHGGCPSSPSTPAQLTTAMTFLQAHPGKVSPVTLDIGASEMLPDLTGCTVGPNFATDLATLDTNLKFILSQLKMALTVDGQVTGSIVMMNYYNPFPNCLATPNAQPFIQAFTEFNKLFTTDVNGCGCGTIVDVFGAFGGITTPNLCTYTWICAVRDIHPMNLGYSVIANTFAAAIPPD